MNAPFLDRILIAKGLLFAFALTGVYVARANTRFDALSARLT